MPSKKHGKDSKHLYAPVLSDAEASEDHTTIGTWSNSELDAHGGSINESKEKLPSSNERSSQTMSPRSSTDANEPLLSDSEDDGTLIEDKTAENSNEEKNQKSFNKAEYTIAFSHFIVCCNSILIYLLESLLTSVANILILNLE
jgi:hypothetical protein